MVQVGNTCQERKGQHMVCSQTSSYHCHPYPICSLFSQAIISLMHTWHSCYTSEASPRSDLLSSVRLCKLEVVSIASKQDAPLLLVASWQPTCVSQPCVSCTHSSPNSWALGLINYLMLVPSCSYGKSGSKASTAFSSRSL